MNADTAEVRKDQPVADERAVRARPSAFGSIALMVLSFPLRIVEFVLVTTLIVVGISTIVIWVGIPILAGALFLTRWFGDLERRWLNTTLGSDIPAAERLSRSGGFLRQWQSLAIDPTTWRDLAYLVILFPLGIIEFVVGLVSIIVLPMAIWVAPWLGWLHSELAYWLLGPNRTRRLENTAQRLQASRARGVDAAEAERRRIERDLHDGAQQRLVSVAMNLGRAKAKLDQDPQALRGLIDEAHADAKLAVSELRDLARGIYPTVLSDRGLDAALSALAAKSPVQVDVVVECEPRPPAAVETTAYFIVSEALANIAKHAEASSAMVRVRRSADTVQLEITDDGRGGATVHPGGGLAGLADRAATIDGTITVVSPVGGPTTIRADLPCTW